MEPPEQRLADAPRALDLVGRGGNLRPERAGAGDRVRTRLDVHAPPQAGMPLRPNARALPTVWSAVTSYWQAAATLFAIEGLEKCARSAHQFAFKPR
jgi:hypothetical protein